VWGFTIPLPSFSALRSGFFGVDSCLLNVQQRHFKKINRAKTQSLKKTISDVVFRPNLASLRPFDVAQDMLCARKHFSELEINPAKTPRRKVTGQGPVIPSKCERSKKDFSPRSK